jgi:hypothetical protein
MLYLDLPPAKEIRRLKTGGSICTRPRVAAAGAMDCFIPQLEQGQID